MSQNIAHLDDVRDALDFSQKFFGVMSKEQVPLAQLVHPLNDLGARRNLAAFLKAGCPVFTLPAAAEPKKTKPTVIELGEFEVNYDETIAAKIAGNADPKRIGWNTDWATDQKFPDTRKGKKRYKASAVRFGKLMPDEDVEQWCKENKKIRATPKEGIDLALVSPRPKLDNVMPLTMAGQFFVDARRARGALCFDRRGVRRRLRGCWLGPSEQWGDGWWFLVLEELPSAA
jgi:hypothetical protein